ncbi:hypothetical protein SH584_08760 [Sphingomonas sp. LY29]|uniref:hypothetical protein n=1 Tax=Sphingomonas sp. LY29 TaxID=3095341 RepID=UPI002D7A0915|nr:hypothetical protein [Sphingomonas sp. LY29]WRP25138.1 hypothetical protein SH584_08760 [Sphingomonas sp. LY29]
MALLTSERTTAALESAERRLADFKAEHARKTAALTGDLDFDGSLALRNEIADLALKVAAASDAADQARRNVEVAQRAKAEAETEREYKAAEKSARAAEKLTLEVSSVADRLAGLLGALEASRLTVEAANARRGARPHIKHGEARVREIPQRITPAVFEKRTVWEDGAGRSPAIFRQLQTGELVPSEGGFTKRVETVVSRAEQVTPAHIPGGLFKDAMRLTGLKGEALFPAR